MRLPATLGRREAAALTWVAVAVAVVLAAVAVRHLVAGRHGGALVNAAYTGTWLVIAYLARQLTRAAALFEFLGRAWGRCERCGRAMTASTGVFVLTRPQVDQMCAAARCQPCADLLVDGQTPAR